MAVSHWFAQRRQLVGSALKGEVPRLFHDCCRSRVKDKLLMNQSDNCDRVFLMRF